MLSIVDPHFYWTDFTLKTFPDIQGHIERCGRVCYKSEERITPGSSDKFVKTICRNNHESVLEHASLTAIIVGSRSMSHQLVRHRVGAAYSQESQRFVKVIKPEIVINTKDEIIAAYLKGLSCNKISKESKGKYTEWEIYQILRKSDIKRRRFGSRCLVDTDFFESIDKPEKAYLLGIILADGNISRGDQLVITQHMDIIWYLRKMFRTFVHPNININKDNGKCGRLQLHSKKIVQDLFCHGIVPNKSYNMTEKDSSRLWSSVPEKFIPDFLRGFLDGDGSVGFGFQKNGKTLAHRLTWLGHKHLLLKIKEWCDSKYGKTKAEVRKVSGTKTLYRFSISSPESVNKCCAAMYANFVYPFGNPLKASSILSQYNIDSPVYSSNNGFQVILPPSFKQTPSLWTWYKAMENASEEYSNLLLNGCKPEDARSVLPNACKTEIAVTYNLRMWRHVIRERALNKHAQWEIRNIFHDIYEDLQVKLPAVFGDLE